MLVVVVVVVVVNASSSNVSSSSSIVVNVDTCLTVSSSIASSACTTDVAGRRHLTVGSILAWATRTQRPFPIYSTEITLAVLHRARLVLGRVIHCAV